MFLLVFSIYVYFSKFLFELGSIYSEPQLLIFFIYELNVR